MLRSVYVVQYDPNQSHMVSMTKKTAGNTKVPVKGWRVGAFVHGAGEWHGTATVGTTAQLLIVNINLRQNLETPIQEKLKTHLQKRLVHER